MISNLANQLSLFLLKHLQSRCCVCAVLIEAPADKIEVIVEQAQAPMQRASRGVLSGFEPPSNAEIVKYPDTTVCLAETKFTGGTVFN